MKTKDLTQQICHDLHRRPWREDDLFFAIAWKDLARIEKILGSRPEALHHATESGVTPAMLAAWMGDGDLMTALNAAADRGQSRAARAISSARWAADLGGTARLRAAG